MSVNFAFLHDALPSLEKFGELAEAYLHTDPNACMIKLGMMAEAMLNIMVSADNVSLPERSDTASAITALSREGYLPGSVADAFHHLRKMRNRAAHEGYDDKEESLFSLKVAHSLCEWFYNAHYDPAYVHKEFAMPPDPGAAGSIAAEAAPNDEDLTRMAREESASMPRATQEERKRQIFKAAEQARERSRKLAEEARERSRRLAENAGERRKRLLEEARERTARLKDEMKERNARQAEEVRECKARLAEKTTAFAEEVEERKARLAEKAKAFAEEAEERKARLAEARTRRSS